MLCKLVFLISTNNSDLVKDEMEYSLFHYVCVCVQLLHIYTLTTKLRIHSLGIVWDGITEMLFLFCVGLIILCEYVSILGLLNLGVPLSLERKWMDL